MNDARYWIILGSEDGIRVDGPISEAEVERRITPDEKYGETYYGTSIEFLSAFDEHGLQDSDRGRRLFVLRGEVVVPTAEEKVTKWRL